MVHPYGLPLPGPRSSHRCGNSRTSPAGWRPEHRWKSNRWPYMPQRPVQCGSSCLRISLVGLRDPRKIQCGLPFKTRQCQDRIAGEPDGNSSSRQFRAHLHSCGEACRNVSQAPERTRLPHPAPWEHSNSSTLHVPPGLAQRRYNAHARSCRPVKRTGSPECTYVPYRHSKHELAPQMQCHPRPEVPCRALPNAMKPSLRM